MSVLIQNRKRKQEFKKMRLRNLWDISKHANIRIVGVPKREEEEQEIENFPNLAKEINVQVQEAERVPNKMNPKRTTPRHIIIKMSRVKDKDNLKSSKRKTELPTKEFPSLRLSADFSKTLQARRDWQEVFKSMKSKDLQPRLLYPARYHSEWKGSKNASQIRSN